MKHTLIALAAVAAVFSALPAHAAEEFTICTGGKTGNYQKAGEVLAKQFGKPVRFVNTNGSLDNLNLVAKGTCDAGFAQADVYDMWRTESSDANNVTPVQDLYTEYTHILCPAKSGIENMDDLAKAKATLIIGPNGSGTAETWRSLRQVDEKKYGNANIDVSTDPVDAGSIQAVKASNGKPRPVCMLWISGLNSTAMQNANGRSWDAATSSPTMQLISVNDKRMRNLPGREGPRYTVQEVTPQKGSAGKPGFYDKLINNGGIFSGSSVDVLAVKAGFFLNTAYKTTMNRDQYNQLLTAVDDASGGLRKDMSPGN